MVNLPVEVLQLIFLQLITRDQLECMTVCRRWRDIILEHSFFCVIYIHTRQQLRQLNWQIKKDRRLGKKVERLIMHLKTTICFEETLFIDLFPNLREFTFMNYDDSYEPIDRFSSQQSQPWRDRIEKIVETMSDRFTFPFLESGKCKSLTHVAISGQEDDTVDGLINALANAPALKKLELKYYEATLDDFERLHSVLPSLSVLYLRNITFDFSSFPSNIAPVTSVTHFHCNSNEYATTENYNQYSRYLSQKYTHLERFEMELYEENGSLTEHKTALKSHLKTLGPRLKALSIKYDEYSGFIKRFDFGMLDECGCQIKSLDLNSTFHRPSLEGLASTTQARCIQSLVVDTLICDDNGSVSLEWLRRFTMLTNLELVFSTASQSENRHQLDLISLLDILDGVQLQTLRLCNLVVEFDDTSSTRAYPSLKELTLSRVIFSQNTDVVISQSFPNLKRLKLRHCTLQGRTLTFTHLGLSYLEIANLYGRSDLYALLITLNNNQHRLYEMGKKSTFFQSSIHGTENDRFSYPYIPSKPYDNSRSIPILTIVCKSVYQFIPLNTWK